MNASSQAIVEIRKKHGLSQEELAHVLGVSFSSINSWELGKRHPQRRMQQLIASLREREVIPRAATLFSQKEEGGISRSNAGFISSVLHYQQRRDPLDYTHGASRWYGSLPSFLVRDLVKLIEMEFSQEGNVYVPFSGSGTVALEFGLAGRKVVATDINPVALLFSRIKTLPCTCPPLLTKEELLKSIRRRGEKSAKSGPAENLLCHPNQWIPPELQSLLRRVITHISATLPPDAQCVCAAALCNIVIDFCNVDKRCTNHYVFRSNPQNIEGFVERLMEEYARLASLNKSLDRLRDFVQPAIRFGSATANPLENEAATVVFAHPPYGNTINYYSISRIQLSVLELFPDVLEALGVGRKESLLCQVKHLDASSGNDKRYLEMSAEWIRESARVLKPQGVLVVIIGDSRRNGFLFHSNTQIIQAASEWGLKLKELFIWITENKAGMHIQRKGHHIDHNYVLLFQKAL